MKETKLCPKCEQQKIYSEFSSNRSKSDGLAIYCKECQAKKQKAWYEKNKAVHKANIRKRTVARIEENRKRLFSYLSSHTCVDCSESDPIVLEFDHVRGDKSKDISALLLQGYSWKTIEKEIAKCDVRCANCHRRATARRGNWKMLDMHS